MKTDLNLDGRAKAAIAGTSRALAALLRKCLVLLLVLFAAGCGDVEWFPDGVEETPTTPAAFSFTPKTNVPLSHEVESESITVSGLEASSASISISGSVGSNSKYSINDEAPTSETGTVKNGDTVVVSHTSSSSLGTTAESTLTIGNRSAKFTSTTVLVQLADFSSFSVSGAYRQAFTTVQSVDGVAGTHVISVKDSRDSGNAQFAVTSDDNPTDWSSATRTVSSLNGRRIYVRNLAATVTSPATTTITINNGDPITVDLTTK